MRDLPNYQVIKPEGRITSIREYLAVADQIKGLIAEGNVKINLDLTAVSEISGSFAGFLTGTLNRLYGLNGDLQITGAGSAIQEILKLVGFYEVIKDNSVK